MSFRTLGCKLNQCETAQMEESLAARGFELVPKAGYESVTLTCVKNNKGIDVLKLQKLVKQRHAIQMDAGYGKLKGQAFRIAHMGDETPATVQDYHAKLDDCLKAL